MIMFCTSCSRRSVENENAAKQTADKTETFREGFEDVTVPPIEEKSTDTASESDVSAEKNLEKREAAMRSAREYLGETDPETGLKYTFSFDGTYRDETGEIVKIRVSVHADDGTYSLCGYLLADENGNITKSEWD